MSRQFNTISKALFLLVFCMSGAVGAVSTAHAQVGGATYYSTQAASPTPTYELQKWRDRSGELPGFASGTSMLLIGAVGIGVITTALVLRSNKKKKKREQEAQFQADSTVTLSSLYGAPTPKSLQERLMDAHRQVPIHVFLGLQRAGLVTSKDAVMVGVSLTF